MGGINRNSRPRNQENSNYLIELPIIIILTNGRLISVNIFEPINGFFILNNRKASKKIIKRIYNLISKW